MAEVVIGLVGALVGATAAVAGQFVVRRREERERWVGLLLEDCAKIYVLEDSYIGAIWEAFGELKQPARLKDWSRTDRAQAQARLTIVCTDDALLSVADSLRENGRAMWHAASSGDQPEWDRLLDKHRQNLAQFVARAKITARQGQTI